MQVAHARGGLTAVPQSFGWHGLCRSPAEGTHLTSGGALLVNQRPPARPAVVACMRFSGSRTINVLRLVERDANSRRTGDKRLAVRFEELTALSKCMLNEAVTPAQS